MDPTIRAQLNKVEVVADPEIEALFPELQRVIVTDRRPPTAGSSPSRSTTPRAIRATRSPTRRSRRSSTRWPSRCSDAETAAARSRTRSGTWRSWTSITELMEMLPSRRLAASRGGPEYGTDRRREDRPEPHGRGPRGRPLRAGDFLSIRPHHVMTHDNTAPVMKKFQAIGAPRVHDPRQPVFVLDHDIQNRSEANLAKYRAIEAFAARAGRRLLSRRARASATRSWSSSSTSCPAPSSSPPTRTPTCTAAWARSARRWCAPTPPRSGPPARSGGRSRAAFGSCSTGELARGGAGQGRDHRPLRSLQPG